MRLAIAVCVFSCVAIGLLSAAAEPSAAGISRTRQQQGTGIVRGRIQDSQGAAVPAATVTLEREGTIQQATSDANGRYSMAGVLPGVYRIEMELIGFRPFTRTDVIVIAGSTATVDGKLRVNIGRSLLSPDGLDATDPARARAVYEAVLPRIYPNASDEIFVERTSLVPVILHRDAWSTSFAAVAELRSTLERAGDRAPVFLRPEAFPARVKLVTAKEFGRRSTSFTPVFFTADGRRAVVYYEHSGGGTMVWLTRTDAGTWQIGGER